MNPESQAWMRLREYASAQIKPGLPDRVMRAAREMQAAAPTLFGQFALSAVTAALCFLAIEVFTSQTAQSGAEDSSNAWQEIVTASQFVGGHAQ